MASRGYVDGACLGKPFTGKKGPGDHQYDQPLRYIEATTYVLLLVPD